MIVLGFEIESDTLIDTAVAKCKQTYDATIYACNKQCTGVAEGMAIFSIIKSTTTSSHHNR